MPKKCLLIPSSLGTIHSRQTNLQIRCEKCQSSRSDVFFYCQAMISAINILLASASFIVGHQTNSLISNTTKIFLKLWIRKKKINHLQHTITYKVFGRREINTNTNANREDISYKTHSAHIKPFPPGG